MLKASALYMVIVIALFISVLCASIIAAAYYYKATRQQNSRYNTLRNNISSAVNLLLANGDNYRTEQIIGLYGSENDSVRLKQYDWGIYDIDVAWSFIQKDTLAKVFSTANTIDSTKWSAIYLIDEDRPLSVSGTTHIKGTVYIPKAGIKEAYVNNQAYTGDDRIVIGTKKNSQKALPALAGIRLKLLQEGFKNHYTTDNALIKRDSTMASFLAGARTIDFNKTPKTLSNITLSGRIILFSDTTITITSSAHLENILVFAPDIVVESGFKGTCQLFATDSIHVGKDCLLDYPSCLGLMANGEKNKTIPLINIENGSKINGVIFSSNSNSSNKTPVISIGSNSIIKGQIYADGLLNLKDKVAVYGSVFTKRFTYQTSYTHYENYLINIDIDASRISPYYLSTSFVPGTTKEKKILQWLE
jgi:hypothetical protein